MWPLLSKWPVRRPADWLDFVNRPQNDAEEAMMKLHISRGRPLGNQSWISATVKSLGLEQTMRPRGRQPGWRKYDENDAKSG